MQGFSQTGDAFWLKPDSVCCMHPSAEADGNETGQKHGWACTQGIPAPASGNTRYKQQIAPPVLPDHLRSHFYKQNAPPVLPDHRWCRATGGSDGDYKSPVRRVRNYKSEPTRFSFNSNGIYAVVSMKD
jgi:hypothetical protein